MFLLAFATQIVVEVFKGMLSKMLTAILVFIVAITITVMWYYAVGAVILGIFTAHAAMNGFDKYKELFDRLKTFKGQ